MQQQTNEATKCPKCGGVFAVASFDRHICREPKVLIATPTLGINPDPDAWLPGLIRIMNDCRRNGYGHALFAPYRQTWWPANNQIWDTAFIHHFDYILRLDDDISGVTYDSFSKLLQANKTVIGAAYCNRRFPYNVQALNKTKEGNLIEIYQGHGKTLDPVVPYGYTGEDIIKVDLVGFGMTLIKVAPFRWLKRPMYRGEEVCPDDTYFAQICAENNIEQFVHMGVKLQHAHVTIQNAGYLYNSDVMEVADREAYEKALKESKLIADKPSEVVKEETAAVESAT